MIRVLETAMAVLVITISLLCLPLFSSRSAIPGITLIGKGQVDGAALDKPGFTGNICQAATLANCVPKAVFGGFGSDLTYTGHDNVFIAAPDRGPFDSWARCVRNPRYQQS
ncbi:MAG TPA: hypothetical protein VJ180_01260 [Pyrinomonadaceae bacterium]|nr:hypothetical protein [Pyrinomonadaceae bacterium]